MRNAEAARYARWAAAIALLIAATVAGVFITRSLRITRAQREAPKPVSTTIQQESAEFTFSKAEQERTIYTVKASRATQFKDQDASELEDVTIVAFGRDSTRNDTLHTNKCTYETGSGRIRCQGPAQIQIESAEAPDHHSDPKDRAIYVETSDVTFDRNSGEASTEAPATFHFPNGDGSATGLIYKSNPGLLRLEHKVEARIRPAHNPNGIPTNVSGSQLTYDRNTHTARLEGTAHARQGNRELSAQEMNLELDKDQHTRRAWARGKPELRSIEPASSEVVSADQFDARLNPGGWIEGVTASGNVRGTKTSAAGADDFSAEQAQVAMEPRNNQPQTMKLTGNPVDIRTKSAAGAQQIQTAAMDLKFAPGTRPSQRRIETATTLAPATIKLTNPDGATTLRTTKARGEFDATNRMRKLYGDSGVEIERQFGSSVPQKTSARKMIASFANGVDWDTIDLDEKVHFTQADRTADARHAIMLKSSNAITLTGAPMVADAETRTSAAKIEIQQDTGAINATGGVRTTYLSTTAPSAANQSANPSIGPGPAHISSDTLTGSGKEGHLIYTGHARMWQGDSVITGETIELWREQQKIEARENVVAVFPQAPATGSGPATQVLWKVRAPILTYWSSEGRAHLENGVHADSPTESLQSRTLDIFLTPVATTAAPSKSAANPTTNQSGRQLDHAIALGNVKVRDRDRVGTSDRADYTAADEKFVLSGGQPTLTDGSNDTTTGRSLTFFQASDTILIDSEAGSRTLTKHRVEK
jgi:lipopolysaccharide export system protein LptA